MTGAAAFCEGVAAREDDEAGSVVGVLEIALRGRFAPLKGAGVAAAGCENYDDVAAAAAGALSIGGRPSSAKLAAEVTASL